MKYTVVICTYNRASLLEQAIKSLLGQTFSKKEFCLVVVDNNSKDETPEVVRSFYGQGLKIQYVFEERQGIAIARNRGAREASTEYFLYLDDDAVAAPDWLEAFDAFNRKADDVYDCVAGLVSLDWGSNLKPEWFPAEYESLLSRYDLGPDILEMTEKHYLLTVNVAFRRKSFFSLNGFREDLGRAGTSLISGEDVDILHRLLKSSFRAAYLPSMRVSHHVSPERQTIRWLARRIYWDGATQPYLDYGPFYNDISGLRRHLLYDLKMLGFYATTALFRKKNRWLTVQRLGRVMSEVKIITKGRPASGSK